MPTKQLEPFQIPEPAPVVFTDEDLLFQPIEQLSLVEPETAVAALNNILATHTFLNYHIRARVGLAEIARQQLTPHLERLKYLGAQSNKFSKQLTDAMEPPYTFKNHDFYGEMIRHFEALPLVCQNLSALLAKYHQYIIDLKHIPTDLVEQTGQLEMVLESCQKVEIMIQGARNTLDTIDLCLVLRKQLNGKRTLYQRENPAVQAEGSKVKPEQRQRTSDIFAIAQQHLSGISQQLHHLENLTLVSTLGTTMFLQYS